MEGFYSKLDYKKVEERIEDYIRTVAVDRPTVIGLSGGIDSSIVCSLATKALGKENVKAIIVRNSRYPGKNVKVARRFAKRLGIVTQEVDITALVGEAVKILGVDEQNIIQTATLDARICDVVIKTFASLEKRIYLGTINGTERLTGWYPKGSLVGDYCPIGGLLKTQEKILAERMGLRDLIKTVSDDASRICSGCGILPGFRGISYRDLDKVLYIYETAAGKQLVKNLENSGIKKQVYEKVLERVNSVKHKNEVFPDFCKISFPAGRRNG